jgi:hypothetical protein
LLSEGWSACGLPFLQSPDIDSNTSQPPPLFAEWLIILWPGTIPIVTSGFFARLVIKLTGHANSHYNSYSAAATARRQRAAFQAELAGGRFRSR